VPAAVRSPLHDLQERHGATFAEFAGGAWADHFGDPLAEHHAVRTEVGVWDISPLRIWEVRGRDAGAAVDRVFTNPVAGAAPGRIRYGALCDAAGPNWLEQCQSACRVDRPIVSRQLLREPVARLHLAGGA